MKLIYILWLIGANIAQPIAQFPDPLHCVISAVGMQKALDKPPRPGLFKAICVETPITSGGNKYETTKIPLASNRD